MPADRDGELLFEELVARHVDLVYGVALSWCGDPAGAEDLAQTALIKAYRAFDRFRAGTSFKAWVLQILRNAFRDDCRAKAREPQAIALHLLEPEQEPPAEPPDPPAVMDLDSKEVFYDLFGDELARLIRELPEEQRLAVILGDVEGLTYKEIADVLGCPVGTVRSRIHRGRAQLQCLLARYAGRIGYLREPKP